MAGRERINAGLIEAHDRGAVGAVAEGLSIVTGDVDLVADRNVLQKPEMSVAMRRIDGDPAFAGVGGTLDMAGPEGQRLAAAARKCDRAGAEPSDSDARVWPGVGPRPRLAACPVVMVSVNARCSNTCASIALPWI